MHTNRCIRSDGDTICSADCTHEAESERDALTEKLARVERERDDAREILRHTNEGLTEIEQQRDTARARVAELEAELARVEGQAAAMRKTLEAVSRSKCLDGRPGLLWEILNALSSTAGQSYVPRAELDAARAEHKRQLEEMSDAAVTLPHDTPDVCPTYYDGCHCEPDPTYMALKEEVARLTRERDALEGRVTKMERALIQSRATIKIADETTDRFTREQANVTFRIIAEALAPPAPGDKDQPGCFTGGAIGQRSRPLTGKEIDEMTQLCEPGPPNQSWVMPDCDNPYCPVGCPDSHCAPYPETACGNAATVNDWEPIESQHGNVLRHDMRVGPCSCGATHTRDNPAPTDEGETGGKP